MAKQITVFKASIPDSPGSLAKVMSQAAAFGLDILSLCATREAGGNGTVFVSPKDVSKALQLSAMGAVELEECAGFLLEGEDKAGAGAMALKPLADASINAEACAALCHNGSYQLLVVVQHADAEKAAKALGV
jgi:hypothetical protein